MKLLKELLQVTQDNEDLILHEEVMNLWEMANLSPIETGIDGYIIFASTGNGVKHGPRIKICKGNKWKNGENVTIPITGMPRIIGDIDISQDDFAKIMKWVDINRETLMKYWNGDIMYTSDFLKALTPINETT